VLAAMFALPAFAQDDASLPQAPSHAQQSQAAPTAPTQQPVAKPSSGKYQDLSQMPSALPESKPEPPATSAAPNTSPAAKPQTASADSTEPSTPASPPAPTPDTKGEDVDNSLPTIVKTVNEVNVVFTVTDKHGHYVKDLKKNDFRVLDDNKPALQIRSFRNETDLPLQVGLLVDASNSVRDRFKFEQEAAIEFLNQIIRHKYDSAFIIGFDTTPEVTQDFTDNTELLSKGVRALRAGGGTAMYDALYFACRDKLLKAPHSAPARKAIILLSDGDDNQSRVTREEAIEMAQRAEVIIYTISTNVSGMKASGDKVLERIADATGGRAFFPFQMRDVSDAFSAIQDELRSQYQLAYIPEDFRPDGRFRSIQIQADQKQFHVRARRGYYAPSK
jgi:VWFA-related protein